MDIDTILKAAIKRGASDIHIVAHHPPLARIHTMMTPLTEFPTVKPDESMRMLRHIANEEQLALFEKMKDSDFSYQLQGVARFRVNVHMQKRSVAISLRAIKEQVPPLADLNLPEVIETCRAAWCWSPATPARVSPPRLPP